MQLSRGIEAGTKTVIGPRLAAERRTRKSHKRRGAWMDGVGRGRGETVRLLGASGSRAFYSHTFSHTRGFFLARALGWFEFV